MKWSAAIGKVCFLSGKSDAPQRRTHLRERVNTFSFCGTGGSFLFCRDRSLRPFAAIGGRKRRTRCGRLLRSAVASIGCAAVVRRGRLRDRWPCALIPFCAPRRVILFKKILRSPPPFARLRQTSWGVLRRITSRTAFCGAYRGKSWPADIFFEFLKKCEK